LCVLVMPSSASRVPTTRGIRWGDRDWVVRRGARGLRPSSWCSTFPGSVLLRGVAHRRYACVVCAHTSASGCSPTRVSPGGTSTGSSAVLPGTAPIELVLDVPGEHAPPGCSAPALRLRCLCAYIGERVLANPGYSREGRVLVRPACCRGLRPSSWCSTFPGSVLLRGVAHRRYACVVCAPTSASGCSPTRVSPGGTSTGSSGVLPGTAPIELVLDVPGERAPSGCSAPALRLRCRCAYVGERVLANPLYSREGRAPARPVGLGRG